MLVTAHEGLRRLTLGDTSLLDAEAIAARPTPQLAGRTAALVRIAALVAVDAPASAYRSPVAAAQRTGARDDDMLALLVLLADVVGSARVISAAPRIALAIGYDAEAALE